MKISGSVSGGKTEDSFVSAFKENGEALIPPGSPKPTIVKSGISDGVCFAVAAVALVPTDTEAADYVESTKKLLRSVAKDTENVDAGKSNEALASLDSMESKELNDIQELFLKARGLDRVEKLANSLLEVGEYETAGKAEKAIKRYALRAGLKGVDALGTIFFPETTVTLMLGADDK